MNYSLNKKPRCIKKFGLSFYLYAGLSILLLSIFFVGIDRSETKSPAASNKPVAISAFESVSLKKVQRPMLSKKDCHAVTKKCVFLTFDDGPWKLEGRFVHILDKNRVPATFFVNGTNFKKFPKSVKALKKSTASVQIHGWDHSNLSYKNSAEIKKDLTRNFNIIKKKIGTSPTCYRPPYGATSNRVRVVAKKMKLTEQFWNVDPQDWAGVNNSAIVNNVMRNAKNNSVILLHSGGGDRTQTLKALPAIIKKLRHNGYTFAYLCK